ncbi:helix-turn-helix domain-containing protein [Thiorhodococcus minor]|uniref:Helix-turn-helix transcriptional regulator n=1 Tax=Thiorhodococcus minor TaxID=57489 RepID=A0A6M0JYR9_9GAMM|nr:helix-turn-helix transcriptional regulator [Thiorhodococcus minor]NEV61517.1 helix-turn-helix transcriptional regulator [Thiorhodococcus minor]
MTDMSSELGNRLRAARKGLNLSQAALAKLAGISQPYYGQIEVGDREPSPEVLRKLAKAADTTVAWLLDGVSEHGVDCAADQRMAVLNDPLVAAGLRALAEDEPMCGVLEISNAEWGVLKSIQMTFQPDKEGYLLLLHAFRHVERLASVGRLAKPRKQRD